MIVIYMTGSGGAGKIIKEIEQPAIPAKDDYVWLPERGRTRVTQIFWRHPNDGDEGIESLNVFVTVEEVK